MAEPARMQPTMSVHTISSIADAAVARLGAVRPVRPLVCALVSAVIATFTPACNAGALPVVTDAQVTYHEEVTRIAFSVSTPIRHHVFMLARPDRVVIDLPDVRWELAASALLQPSGLFEGMRHGRFKPGTSRVVIDTRGPVMVQDSALIALGSAGYRLVVDLSPARGKESTTVAPETTSSPSSSSRTDIATAPGPKVGGTAQASLVGATGLGTGDIGLSPRSAGTLSLGQGATTASAFAFATPKPRPRAAAAPPSVQWVVAVDAGHGGQDPGGISRDGVQEKQITLAMARALREELKTLRHYKVVLTRNNDKFIRLRDRIAIARTAGADMFISLHADKTPNTTVRGLSVYTLSERASDAEAAALAERENKVDLIAGLKLAGETPEVTNILIDLVQRETMNDSAQVASLLVGELSEETLLLPRTHRFAGFAVLKAPDVPSVLIELGYLSNPIDETLLGSSNHRRKLAQGIARAIDRYFIRVEVRNRK
jgi:N-acetylmuramoyl-L-alanine amidase